MKLTRDTRLLFIGDSITDCGQRECIDRLGNGYVKLIRDLLAARDPANCPIVINRGIGGDEVKDLEKRWEESVMAEKPDVLSIKIGINDVWRQLDGRKPGTKIEQYVPIYRSLLERTRDAFPAIQFVLCEPTVIVPPAPDGTAMLQPYIQAVRDLANEFSAVLVPLHKPYMDAMAARPDLDWAADGVHPSSVGHMLIARTWLATCGVW